MCSNKVNFFMSTTTPTVEPEMTFEELKKEIATIYKPREMDPVEGFTQAKVKPIFITSTDLHKSNQY